MTVDQANKLANILNLDILKERFDQHAKWGEQDHTLPQWLAIAAEESGEVAQEVVDHHFHGLDLSNVANLRTELIQTAAVYVQIVEWLDKKIEESTPGFPPLAEVLG